MRLGIISDIHCDLPALERTFRVMPPVDHILCAGDMMLQYRFSNDLFDLIRERNVVPVLGNHDAHILASGGAMMRKSGQIRPDHLEYLSSLPTVAHLELGGKRIVMMHTSRMDPTGGGRGLTNGVGIPPRHARFELGDGGHEMHRIQPATPGGEGASAVAQGAGAAAAAPQAARTIVDEHSGRHHEAPGHHHLPEADADVLIVGHTHLPVIAYVDGTLVINPGSLAQPRDVNNPDLRTYAIVETDTWEVSIHSFKEAIGAVYR